MVYAIGEYQLHASTNQLKNTDLHAIIAYQYPFKKMNLLGAVDEWNTKAICKQFIPCSPCMIHGFIAEHFSTLGRRLVFVVPSNHLLQEKSKKRLNATIFN